MRLDDTSLEATLRRLDQIGSHLRLPSTYKSFPDYLPELRNIISILEYHAQPKGGIELTETFFGPQAHCHHDGCMKSWRDIDACLLNFSGRWFCRDHHPPITDGGIHPPGYQPPVAAREHLQTARQAVLKKISRDELKLVNTRI